MIVTSKMIKEKFKKYGNKDMKISREVKNNKLFKVKNGLYETDSHVCSHYLAGAIYGPSYISFDYALYLYGLIPERAVNPTSATLNKKKKKVFKNFFGIFYYMDVPEKVYPLDVILIEENGYSFQIATKEKALCDKLYTLSPIKNLDELEYMLFQDLRIDEEEFYNLDYENIKYIASKYKSTNVKLLEKYLRRLKNE